MARASLSSTAPRSAWVRAVLRVTALATLLGLACLPCAAGTVAIAEASSGLAFSQAEVGAYAAPLRQRFLDQAEAGQERGCAEQCTQIARVWQRVLPAGLAQQPLTPLRLELVTSAGVDALSFADGTIVLSAAFVRRLGLDDAQLAFVLAHEVAHILLQHERQTLTSAMALMAPAPVNRASEVYDEMQARYFVLDSALSLIAQQTEWEADEVGVQLAALAGFDPRRQLAFMQRLADQGQQGQSMVSTHPTAAQRLEKLQAMLPLALRLFAVGGDALHSP